MIQRILFCLTLSLGIFNCSFAQESKTDTTKQELEYHVITKHDGSEFIGVIITQDAREILLRTKDLGDIYIPKHEIKQIDKISAKEAEKHIDRVAIDELFATRYFLTTNGFATPKGNHYAYFSILGPEVHFAVSDRTTIGIMSSWIGSPIVLAPKFTLTNPDSDVQFGVGGLFGTAGYIAPEWGLAVPYAALTFGSKKANINISAGYGVAGDFGSIDGGQFLFSLGGVVQASRKLKFVFDSMMISYEQRNYNYNSNNNTYTTSTEAIFLIMPGVRYQVETNKAFQFGFANLANSGNGFDYIPIPMLGWFRAL